ncbi:MAG TPA: sialidase family protein [Actinomycetota bacterium]|nr:sialidase family protein [Actinomycetota bacterium]
MRRLQTILACALLFASILAASGPGAEAAKPQSLMAGRRSVDAALLAQARANANGASTGVDNPAPSEIECATETIGPSDHNLDCDHPWLPKNEQDIEVDPNDPLHMVVSANDYESCCDQYDTTFDGGDHWTTGDMSKEDLTRIGSDPVTVFDPVSHNVIHSSLNFTFNQDGADDGDLVVSLSHNGGLTWPDVVVVGNGLGDDNDPSQLFWDKEWLVTDTNPLSPYYGRTYMTSTLFFSEFGAYKKSPIYLSYSDDGGETWTSPKVISGKSNALCTFQVAGASGVCDQDQFSVPTVGPDGTVYVAFENEQNQSIWEGPGEVDNQYLLVRSFDGGATWTKPRFVVGMEDGRSDYPINVDGRQTVSKLQFRLNSAGNIVADPDNNGQLYVAFSDNRNGTKQETNVDVFLMRSTNGGQTWSGPHLVSDAPGDDLDLSDQWFPWVDVSSQGTVGVVYNDRTGVGTYEVTFAETAPWGGGSPSWTYTDVTSAASNPRNSLVFQAGVQGCFKCATFIGDYINVDYGSDEAANLAWTDMRQFVVLGSNPLDQGYTQHSFFRRIP